MLDFSWSELLVIGIVALVFIGPKELPGVLRTLGQWMSKVRRMASEFQNQFHDAMREAELADLKKEVDQMAAQAHSIDPLADVRKDMENAQREIESAVAGTPAETKSTTADAGSPTPPVEAAPPASPAEPATAATEPVREAPPSKTGWAGGEPV
jgi:sec-independent protein translocase protein TatB